MTSLTLRPMNSSRRSGPSSAASASRATGPRTGAACSPNMPSPKSRATRSSWPLEPTGSRTSPKLPTLGRRTRWRARSNDPLDAHVPERTCILTRRTAPREELIRLALGPDGDIAPDVRARAARRGACIRVAQVELDGANAKGKLKAALSRAFKTSDVKVPADLGERTAAALRQGGLQRPGAGGGAGERVS